MEKSCLVLNYFLKYAHNYHFVDVREIVTSFIVCRQVFQNGKQNYVCIGPFSKQRNLFSCIASLSMVFLSNKNDKSTYTKVENQFNV